MKKLLIPLLVLLLALSACAREEEPQPAFNPTIAVDEVCEGLLNNTFVTRENLQSGGEEGALIAYPLRVSFLMDGRVIWNYEDNQSYIGTFACENGVVQATFTEGSQPQFTGTYNPDAGTFKIGEVVYYVDTDI